MYPAKHLNTNLEFSMLVPSILLIDDDEVDAEAVRRSFRLHQLPNQIIHALDGLEALDLLCGKAAIPPLPKPYIILLDINLPRMNGLEFLRQLRQDPDLKSSVVFVLTTSNRPEDKVAAYQKQVAGYILKENVGQNFRDAIRLLKDYQTVVILPD